MNPGSLFRCLFALFLLLRELSTFFFWVHCACKQVTACQPFAAEQEISRFSWNFFNYIGLLCALMRSNRVNEPQNIKMLSRTKEKKQRKTIITIKLAIQDVRVQTADFQAAVL